MKVPAAVAASLPWPVQDHPNYFDAGAVTSAGLVSSEGAVTALVEAGGTAVGAVSAPANSSERMVMAMRRLRARPSGVALSATGRNRSEERRVGKEGRSRWSP